MSGSDVRSFVDDLYRSDSRRVFATLIRLVGDFDLAEEALHDAFAAAVEDWERDGIPTNPRAWLVSTGRFKAIDVLRRRARFDASKPDIAKPVDDVKTDEEDVQDDRLRLIFTCCHPALSPAAQVALTLREVCGLSTEDIAAAFLTAPSAIAQRIVRDRRRRSRNASCAASQRFATPAFRIRYRPSPTCRSGSIRRSPSSTWCSTKATPHHPASR